MLSQLLQKSEQTRSATQISNRSPPRSHHAIARRRGHLDRPRLDVSCRPSPGEVRARPGRRLPRGRPAAADARLRRRRVRPPDFESLTAALRRRGGRRGRPHSLPDRRVRRSRAARDPRTPAATVDIPGRIRVGPTRSVPCAGREAHVQTLLAEPAETGSRPELSVVHHAEEIAHVAELHRAIRSVHGGATKVL